MTNQTLLPIEQNFETTLAQVLNDGASDLTVYCARVPTATIPSSYKVIFTLEPKTEREENILVETITTATNVLTVSTGGRAQNLGNGKTGTRYEHPVGSKVIISDAYPIYADTKTAIESKFNTAGGTITGAVDFSGASTTFRIPNLTTVQRDALASPANGMLIYNTTDGVQQIYDAGAWADVDTGGAVPNASETVAGIVEIPTQSETDAGTSTGGTGAILAVSPDKLAQAVMKQAYSFGADAGANDTYVITLTPAPSAYTTGAQFTFTANTANTGAATLNINSLGAITLKKNKDEDLETGDIKAGQAVVVMYDSTGPVFQVLSVNGSPISKNVLNAKGDLISASAADTPSILTVGSNGKILRALSTEASGLKWDDEFMLGNKGFGNYFTLPIDLAGATQVGTGGTANSRYASSVSAESTNGYNTGALRTYLAGNRVGASSLTNFVLEFEFSFEGTAKIDGRIGLASDAAVFIAAYANTSNAFVGFAREGDPLGGTANNLWVETLTGGVLTKTQVITTTGTHFSRLARIVFTSSSVGFYLDNVLVATHTLSIPVVSNDYILGHGTVEITADGSGHGWLMTTPILSAIYSELYDQF